MSSTSSDVCELWSGEGVVDLPPSSNSYSCLPVRMGIPARFIRDAVKKNVYLDKKSKTENDRVAINQGPTEDMERRELPSAAESSQSLLRYQYQAAPPPYLAFVCSSGGCPSRKCFGDCSSHSVSSTYSEIWPHNTRLRLSYFPGQNTRPCNRDVYVCSSD